MGDAVMKTNPDRNFRRGITVALTAAILAWGCASAKPEASSPDPASSARANPAPAASAQPAPAEISRLEVTEAAPGARIEIGAQQALVWTTFRDADGNLVVELPNSRPSAALGDQTFDSGLVSSVHVTGDGPADRPLTRVVIATRERAEHRLDAEAQGLLIDLVPSEEPRAAVAQAPAAAAPAASEPTHAVAPAAQPQAAPAAPETLAAAGTPDQPVFAPAPSGAPATRLEGFERVSDSTIRIAGNGEFAYSTFRLENPERFVIDLEGVVNASDRGTLPVDEGSVARVRVSQFRTQPEPVSRVVFDLTSPTVPSIERTSGGLIVRFGDAATQSVAAAPATAQPQATTVAEVAEAAEVTAERSRPGGADRRRAAGDDGDRAGRQRRRGVLRPGPAGPGAARGHEGRPAHGERGGLRSRRRPAGGPDGHHAGHRAAHPGLDRGGPDADRSQEGVFRRADQPRPA